MLNRNSLGLAEDGFSVKKKVYNKTGLIEYTLQAMWHSPKCQLQLFCRQHSQWKYGTQYTYSTVYEKQASNAALEVLYSNKLVKCTL